MSRRRDLDYPGEVLSMPRRAGAVNLHETRVRQSDEDDPTKALYVNRMWKNLTERDHIAAVNADVSRP